MSATPNWHVTNIVTRIGASPINRPVDETHWKDALVPFRESGQVRWLGLEDRATRSISLSVATMATGTVQLILHFAWVVESLPRLEL